MSHGNSKAHRSAGSMGQNQVRPIPLLLFAFLSSCSTPPFPYSSSPLSPLLASVQDPGRVVPGKKAPGRLGGISSTVRNSTVQRIDTTLNLLFLRGAVPGFDGNYVRITDAFYGVQRAGMVGLKRGKGKEEVLKNVRELPFPMGDMELAKTLPVVVDAAADAVKTGRLGL